MGDHLFPLLFPKNSKSLKYLDIRLQEVEAKIRLNGTSKVNRHTDKHTNTHMDKSTYRKHRPRVEKLQKIVCILASIWLSCINFQKLISTHKHDQYSNMNFSAGRSQNDSPSLLSERLWSCLSSLKVWMLTSAHLRSSSSLKMVTFST